MKTKLEVGMYVRTNTGIHKCITVYTDNRRTFDRFANEFGNMIFFDEIIGEPSFDILDVIRPGDYVNGDKVSFIAFGSIYWNTGNAMHKKYIETVVTKEQFEECKYEVNHEKINK